MFEVILLLLVFIEGSLNLVFLLLICRFLLLSDSKNYYLAFFLGLLLSLLKVYPLGYFSLIFLIVCYFLHFFRKSTISSQWFIIIPITLLCSLFLSFCNLIFLKMSIDPRPVIIQSLVSLPLFLIVKNIRRF